MIRILPYGGNSVRADIAGRLLRQLLTVGRENAGGGGYLQVSGAGFDSAGALIVGTAPVDDARRYRVVLTDFLLSGGEAGLGFLTRRNADVTIIRELRDIRQSLIQELRRM